MDRLSTMTSSVSLLLRLRQNTRNGGDKSALFCRVTFRRARLVTLSNVQEKSTCTGRGLSSLQIITISEGPSGYSVR